MVTIRNLTLFLLASLFLGCTHTSELKKETAMQTDCMPNEVEIIDSSSNSWVGTVTWTATCQNKLYLCYARGGVATQCKIKKKQLAE